MGTVHNLQSQMSNSRPTCPQGLCNCGLAVNPVQVLDWLQKATSWNIQSLLEKKSPAEEFTGVSIKFWEIDQLPMNIMFSRKFTPNEEEYQLFAITVLILSDLIPRGISPQLWGDNVSVTLIAKKENHKVCRQVLPKLAVKLTEAYSKWIIVFPALLGSTHNDE